MAHWHTYCTPEELKQLEADQKACAEHKSAARIHRVNIRRMYDLAKGRRYYHTKRAAQAGN